MEGVIRDVAYEEERGKEKRRKHGRPVLNDPPGTDEAETCYERQGGQSVEQGVECWKKKQVRTCNVGGRMIINQPAKEQAREGADSQNREDYTDWRTFVIACRRRHLLKSKQHGFPSSEDAMKRYFVPNLQAKGRIVRGFVSLIFLLAAVSTFPLSAPLSLLLLASGLFALFEALRGWCVLRACGLRTKI